MAHMIDRTTGGAACMVAGAPAWHRLGVVVEEAQTSADAIRLARLNWAVEKWPVRAFAPEGAAAAGAFPAGRAVDGKFATVRTDTFATLGIVGSDYTPFQNVDAFDFMDSLVTDGSLRFETAGALNAGRRVWMLARMPKTIEVVPGDEVRPYVLLTNSHDGSSALRMLPTTVRVVCANTLSLALGRSKASEGLSITHHESLPARVEEARRKLGLVAARMEQFAGQAHQLARVQMATPQLAAYFAQLVAARSEKHQKRVLEQFLANFEDGTNTIPGMKGSAWAAYNSVSEYADHQLGVRGRDDAARLNNRLASVWFGPGNDLKQRAWEAALALAV